MGPRTGMTPRKSTSSMRVVGGRWGIATVSCWSELRIGAGLDGLLVEADICGAIVWL